MDVFLQTFIDPVKWDAARWKATAFFHDPKGVRPPCLGIVFDNIGTGKQIFSDWLKRLGNVDQYDELRISIVEGERSSEWGLGIQYIYPQIPITPPNGQQPWE